MLNPSQESAGSSTPPRPELNPLLNPLLADNMQRWADVYFSTAPEHRDQAVRALLEELREEESTARTMKQDSSHHPVVDNSDALHADAENIRCARCGQENPRRYQYCGSCGSELKMPADAAVAPERDESDGREWQCWEGPGYSEADAVPESQPAPSPSYASAYNGLSFLQLGAERESDAPNFLYEPAPSHRYRVYIGLFLAIVIGGLGYRAWKGTKGNDSSYVPAPPPMSATDSVAPAKSGEPPSASEPQKAESTTDTKAAPAAMKKEAATKELNTSPPADSGAPLSAAAEKSGEDNAAAGQPSPRKIAPKALLGAVPNGSEELATAQEYLSRRNTALAAPWLWKSVSKHNGQATLLLADLYLKGDGVSKNCDQARILLDSAARKGVSGAGARLRHLTAFGCQ